VKEIELSRGLVALVDDEDEEMVKRYRWWAVWDEDRKTFDVVSHPNRVTIYMHRLILGLQPHDGIQGDHKNHNGLDNRRLNLRVCNQSQNAANTRKKCGVSSSQFKGVHWFKGTNRWRAQIYVNKRKISLGYFKDEVVAAVTYDTAARKYFGEFAYLNFPEEGQA
jgi:hypothetical protein